MLKVGANILYWALTICSNSLNKIFGVFMYIIVRRNANRIANGIIAIVILLLANGADAVPIEEWNTTFVGFEDARYVQQTSDSGYIILGYSFTLENSFDISLIKIESNGKERWRKVIEGPHWDDAYSVQQTSDNGYIIAGMTKLKDLGDFDAWLIKTDAEGNKQWSRTFGGTDKDYFTSLQQTADNGYILAGTTTSFGSGNQDAWLIKTDSNGNQEWRKIYGGNSYDGVYSIQKTSDKGYILAGWTDSYGAGSYDAWIIKVDENGNQQWTKTFGGTSHDEASSIQQTPDDGYIFAGMTKSYGAGDFDAWLVKIDTTGNEQWSKTFGGSDQDNAIFVQQSLEGGYIIIGSTKSYGAGDFDAWIIEIDENGSQNWSKTIGGTDEEIASSAKQTSDKGYVVTGSTSQGFLSGEKDAWIIKLSNLIIPNQLPTTDVIPNQTAAISETQIESPKEKSMGFEIILAITMLFVALIIRRRMNK